MRAMYALAVAAIGAAAPVQAVTVGVTIRGEVEFNQISAPPLGNVNSGDPAEMTFLLDSDDFVDGTLFPTRGYAINQASFSYTLGAVTIGLQNPFPAGETPYFVLRDNDPAVDGFFLASSPDVGFPNGVPLDQLGIFEQFRDNFAVTYGGDTLSSLDIIDAEGFYDFTGLTVFSFSITDGPFDAMGLVFTDMTITVRDVAPLGQCCQGGFAGTVCLVNTEAECLSSGQFISWTEGGNCDNGDASCEVDEPFAGCGTLVQGVECVLFQADAGGLFLLENLGGFGVGDSVFVTGILDPDCFTFCLQGDGCIFQNTIEACVVEPLGQCCQGGFVGTVCLVNTEAECLSSGQFISWTEGGNCDDGDASCDEDDTTPPDVECDATPSGGTLVISYSATDDSGSADVTAIIDIGCDQIPVEDGQVIALECLEADASRAAHAGGGFGASGGFGGGGEMVTICHIPPGNPGNAHTIVVGEAALRAHLAHGDTLGPCGDDCAFDFDGDVLVISSTQAVLIATATDPSGNTADCELDLCLLPAAATAPRFCSADLDRDGGVGIDDMMRLFEDWGPSRFGRADLTRDGRVDTDDVIELVLSWGPCL